MTDKGNIALGVLAIGVGIGAIVLARRGTNGGNGGLIITEQLVAGNNEIVFQGSTRDIATAFFGYEAEINSVWWYDWEALTWRSYSPGAPSDLYYLVQGETYVIHANVDCEWTYEK